MIALRLTIDDWIFDVDIAANIIRSAEEAAEHCTCGYCRNYYEAVDRFFPSLRKLLGQFGLCAEAPDELMPYEADMNIWYDGCFAVRGRILSTGPKAMQADGVTVRVNKDNIWQVNHQCQAPCFVLMIEGLCLPWVLDEPLNSVESPVGKRTLWDRPTRGNRGTLFRS